MFTAALFTTARPWKQPKGPSTEEWIEKTWYIYTMEYLLLSHKKEHINAMYSNTDTTTDDQTKSEGERQT